MINTVYIWDEDGSPPTGDWKIILWRGFHDSDDSRIISIPQYVEEHADDLKDSYLSWIYELGEQCLDGRRLSDYFILRPGFSYWWMTLMSEKSSYSKSPQIIDVIRLLAFEKWISTSIPEFITLESSNTLLADSIKSWCATNGVKFEWKVAKKKGSSKTFIKRIFHLLPYSLKALTYLAYYVLQRWKLRGSGVNYWRKSTGVLTFISYFFNLAPQAVKEGRYESFYWANLPCLLQKAKYKINWLHVVVNESTAIKSDCAAKIIKQFNKSGEEKHIHVTLDSFLGVRVVFRILRDWLRIYISASGIYHSLTLKKWHGFEIMPFFKKDWYRSFFGIEAMSNLIMYNLLETAFVELPKQSIGVYLQENQPWEFAFIHAWRMAGHGQLIGTPHSTVCYWDLRYFFDNRTYDTSNGVNRMPRPDMVALNGAAAIHAYVKGGYPDDEIVEVEALRYLYLNSKIPDSATDLLLAEGNLRVLVLCDYLPKNTQHQLRLLEIATSFISKEINIIVKPHPAHPVNPEDYPGLKMAVSMAPVSILLLECDVAYTSNSTSAAVDAYCMGVPVVSALDSNGLNFSPLRGYVGVLFAKYPEELSLMLTSVALTGRAYTGRNSFFTIDSALPRWKKLLHCDTTLCDKF